MAFFCFANFPTQTNEMNILNFALVWRGLAWPSRANQSFVYISSTIQNKNKTEIKLCALSLCVCASARWLLEVNKRKSASIIQTEQASIFSFVEFHDCFYWRNGEVRRLIKISTHNCYVPCVQNHIQLSCE